MKKKLLIILIIVVSLSIIIFKINIPNELYKKYANNEKINKIKNILLNKDEEKNKEIIGSLIFEDWNINYNIKKYKYNMKSIFDVEYKNEINEFILYQNRQKIYLYKPKEDVYINLDFNNNTISELTVIKIALSVLQVIDNNKLYNNLSFKDNKYKWHLKLGEHKKILEYLYGLIINDYGKLSDLFVQSLLINEKILVNDNNIEETKKEVLMKYCSKMDLQFECYFDDEKINIKTNIITADRNFQIKEIIKKNNQEIKIKDIPKDKVVSIYEYMYIR